MYATFLFKNVAGHDKLLLGIALKGSDIGQIADEFIKFLDFVLSIFDRNRSHIAPVIGDSSSTNRAFSRKLRSLFVGCNSHKSNHAVNDLLLAYKDILEKLNDFMTKISYRTPAPLL